MGSSAQTIVIDDLIDPRLTETQRQVLEYTESRPVSLDIDQMIDEAIAGAGSDDLGYTTDFAARLAAFAGAVDADTALTQLGRGTLRSRIVRLLRNRISLADLIKRYPEVESIEIEKPIIVVGMPRSGTTHLVNLLAADRRRRALPYWESQEPIPASGRGPDIFGVDPRYSRAKAEHDAMLANMPLVAAMHDQFPEAIEEEVELLDLDFASYILEWLARVPSWRDTYLALDQIQHYGYMKKVLQALTFFRGPRTWVLKSPQHSEQLPALMATFPDATVAFTHRDPVAVIQSTVTMMAYADRLRRRSIDPEWLIEYWTDRIHRLLSAGVRDRDLVAAERSIDVGFHQLGGNEITVLEALYGRAGIELTPGVRKSFERYLGSNPRGKHGAIRYDLHRHFGVTPEDVRSRFDFYFDRFDIRPEVGSRVGES